MDEQIRQRVVAHGRVQGVWFRDSVRQQAESLGLAGWVRNRADGSVEAVFEGPTVGVTRAVEWCHHGPERAHVERLDVVSEPPEGLGGFSILS